MKQTTAGQIQLQAKDGIQTVTAQLDQETLRHLQSVHKAVREILGNGTFYGISLFGPSFEPFTFMVEAPGAFVGLGLMLCVMNMLESK